MSVAELNNNMVLARESVDSVILFKSFWFLIKPLGIGFNVTGFRRQLLKIYDIFVIVAFCILYGLHLLVGLFVLDNKGELVRALSISTSCWTAAFKYLCLRYNNDKMHHIERLLSELDKRVESQADYEFFVANVKIPGLRVLRTFTICYTISNTAAISMWLLSLTKQRGLLYVGWFPHDWHYPTWWFICCGAYQAIGVTALVFMNIHDDIYAPMTMAIMSGHVQLLAKRIERMGDGTPEEAEAKMHTCIEDHKKLLLMFDLLQETVSYYLFTQMMASGLVLSMAIIYLVFMADSVFIRVYYFVYAFVMMVQNFPACYYGSTLVTESAKLTNAIFSADWSTKNRKFRSTMFMFMERTLKPMQLMVGGVTLVTLSTFVSIVRAAYSIYCLTLNV